MAEKGHVKGVKDGSTSSGGTMVSTDTTTSSSAAGTTSGTVDPSTIIVTVTSDRSGMAYDFNLPFYAAMNISVGDLVSFEVLDGGGNKPTVPVYLERIDQGTIKSINADGASGTIAEKGSGVTINF